MIIPATSPRLYSVIIPTCNRPELLFILLNALTPQVGDEGEIIVTDDSYSEETACAISTRFPNVQFVAGPKRWLAANRNCGASHASGKWLIFLDDDVIPDPGFIAAYLEKMRSDCGADVLEGRTYSDVDIDLSRFEAPINETGGRLWGCNLAISRELYLDIGGFCEVFHTYGGEDIDFQDRLQSLHAGIEFIYNAGAYHKPRQIPSVYHFAKRWEGCTIHRLIKGAGVLEIMLTLPRHIFAFGMGQARGFPRWSDKVRWIARAAGVSGLVSFFLPRWILRNYRPARAEALRRRNLIR